MLEIQNLSKFYSIGKNVEEVKALKDINISMGESGLVMIVGTSGCGKTTLLNILGGIDVPTQGKVVCDGEEVDFSSNKVLDIYRSEVVSFVFQDYNLLYEYTVLENIKLAMQIQKMDKDVADERATTALEAVGLSHVADRKISALSGGQQQRIAIARAIAKDSKFILCDEPTGNLDSTNSNEIFSLLKELSQDRLIIVVTHDAKMADKYADRIIRLEDGEVVEDSIKSNKSATKTSSVTTYDEVDVAPKKVNKKKRGVLSVRNVFVMIKDNIFKSLLSNITMLCALLATFTLVTSFFSLYRYSEKTAYVNTLKANNQYVLPITKYVDQLVEMPGETEDDNVTNNGTAKNASSSETKYMYGPTLDYENADPSAIPDLLKLVDNKASFYSSYFFNKNLQDFTDKTIIQESKKFQFYAYGFRDIVAVDNYDTFNMELLAGKKPTATNDVLIYDYMAKSMIEYKLFDTSIKNVQDVVGQTLTDVDTGLTMNIVGILKSNYEKYTYIQEGLNNYEFEETYLSGLQTVFCKTELIEQVQKDKTYNSFFKASAYDSTAGEGAKSYELSYKKMRYLTKEQVQSLNLIATVDDSTDALFSSRGIIMSQSQVAKILGLNSASEVTADVAKNFITNYRIEILCNIYDFSYSRSYSYLDGYGVIGVCADNVETSNILGNNTVGTMAIYTHSEEDLTMGNGQFRQIFLSLGTNWSVNAQVIDKFFTESHDLQFYLDNEGYKQEGYTLFSPYSVLISDANVYMTSVKTFASYIMYLLIALTVVFILIYTYITLKRYNYKIGVLKALGANSWNVLLVFGLQMLLVSLVAFLISLPISFAVMSRINYSFVADINSTMVFFAVDGLAVTISLLFATLGVILVALIPLIRLCLSSPISVIRGSRNDE